MTSPLLRPFRALRPAPGLAQQVIAPPYDVVSTEEARLRAAGKPLSFLHISKPEIDFPPGTDASSAEVYARARETLRRLVADGVLIRDMKPCYYVYRLAAGNHVQTGIVGGALVSEYEGSRIRRHEFTRPDKEDDRVRQIEAVAAQTGPVLLIHRPDAAVGKVIAEATREPPAVDALADDGVRHALWVVDGDAAIRSLNEAFAGMDRLYIADGHHRSAAAARVAAGRRARASAIDPKSPHEAFLAVSFPADQMRILDYNRVVRDLGGLTIGDFLARIGERFVVEASDAPVRPSAAHTFGLYLEGRWFRLITRDPPAAGDPIAALDVSLLAERLLAPILGIVDPRHDRRIDFVGGARGLEGLTARVDSGEMAAAFALHPTSVADLMAVADAGEIMPPKSTWFEPKLADGMASLVLD